MTTTTSTGHTLTLDLDAMLLRIGGDLDTMDRIPESEIDAACAATGVRCTYDASAPDAYRLAPDSGWVDLPGLDGLSVKIEDGRPVRLSMHGEQPRRTVEILEAVRTLTGCTVKIGEWQDGDHPTKIEAVANLTIAD